MKAFLDGNALCITKDDFVNLQESDCVFISLGKQQHRKIREMVLEEMKPI